MLCKIMLLKLIFNFTFSEFSLKPSNEKSIKSAIIIFVSPKISKSIFV